MPSLGAIGKGLSFSLKPGIDPASVDVKLNALTSVGGDISGTFPDSNTTLSGLGSLNSVNGNVTLIGGGDFHAGAFLPGLLNVGGSVHVESSFHTSQLFNALLTIEGDLTLARFAIDQIASAQLFENPLSVGGGVHVLSVGWVNPHLRSLRTVGGALDISAARR